MTTIEPVEGLNLSEHHFTADDGAELFYRTWLPDSGKASKAILLFHRGHEHSGRLAQLVRDLNLPDYAFFAWDARGHGQSPGERGYAEHFGRVVADMDRFVRHVSETHAIDIRDMAIVGHSVGAVGVAAWVHDYAPPIRAMVLATPAFEVKLYVPLAIPGLRFAYQMGWMKTVTSYVKSRVLTHDFQQQQGYDTDTLISKQIATNILLDLYDTSKRLVADAGAIVAPTLILTAGRDWVVKTKPQRLFYERLSSPIKQWRSYNDFYHAIFHERDRAKPIADMRAFIVDRFAEPAPPGRGVDLLEADKQGFTRYEYDTLQSHLPLLSLKGLNFASQRLTLQTVGRLSDGIALGWKTGFDSGESLDHVYRNTPSGQTPLGWFTDKQYINAIGWRGIRQRKIHLQELLREAIRRVRADHRPAQIVDIAAGPGRYALEVLKENTVNPVSAVLRDRSVSGLSQGEKIAAEMSVTNVRYERGDAFSAESIASITPQPNIVIVSGLYELFGDNSMVLGSLRALSARMEAGSFLIYTGQPWHPQIEMIARVLINRDGDPWIMRRRTQAELDDLVAAAGFAKKLMRIDRWGIFTVSLAVKL